MLNGIKRNLRIAAIATVVAIMLGTAINAVPNKPVEYTVVTVQYGDTVEELVKEHNAPDADYDIREAVAEAMAKGKEQGGASSRQLKVGDKVFVPIYR